MARAHSRHLSLSGIQVDKHAVPMTALADVLVRWDTAMRAALPSLVTRCGLGGHEDFEAIRLVEPMASPARPGSYEQAYSYGVPRTSVQHEMPWFLVGTTLLDDLSGTFEHGISRLQHGEVADWITPAVAKPLVETIATLAKRDLTLKLVEASTVLSELAADTLSKFISDDEGGRETELQVFGTITGVNVRQRYALLESTGHGNVRASFAANRREEICTAMAKDLPLEALVRATLTSDRKLVNAKIRDFRTLSTERNYSAMFRRLWGSARDTFAGVPHDERGVPDPDPDPSGNV